VADADSEPSNAARLQSKATAFRKRAKGLRGISYGILGLIVVLLIVGAIVFVNASKLTLEDFAPEHDYSKRIVDLTGKRPALSAKVSREQTEYYESVQKRADTLGPAYDSYIQLVLHAGGSPANVQNASMTISDDNIADPMSTLRGNLLGCRIPCVISFSRAGKEPTAYAVTSEAALEKLKADFPSFKPPPILPLPAPSDELQRDSNELSALDSALSQLKQRQVQAETSKLVGSAPQQAPESKSEPAPLAQIIQTNVTRFGTILMILFLVTILTPLYRYNIRLSTYYDARADVIDLCATDVKDVGFAELTAALTPTFDFGRAPETPIEQVLQLVRQVASKGKGEEAP
jgi:hypothetical protein